MKKVNWRELNIKPCNILFSFTSEPDYEMDRQILLEFDYADDDYNENYVVLDGWHCICYDFDGTEWEAIEYTKEELIKLSNTDYNKHNTFWKMVRGYLNS